jgi:hypothetical protein
MDISFILRVQAPGGSALLIDRFMMIYTEVWTLEDVLKRMRLNARIAAAQKRNPDGNAGAN